MAQTSKKSVRSASNFLEALRDLSKGVVDEAKIHVKQVVDSDIPQAFGGSGTIEPNGSFSMADLKAAERQGEHKAEARFTNRLQEERLVFLRSENETKAQVKAIQEEIHSIAKSMGELAKEVQVAASQAPINPGAYHRSFFERLRGYLKALRLKVAESKQWLAQQNARASKRNHYWGQVKQSGTKFMLSSERYMVTSTG